jgi:hypothetical protein
VRYKKLFIEVLGRVVLRRNPALAAEAMEEWDRLAGDEEFVRRLDEWAVERSGFKAFVEAENEISLACMQAGKGGRPLMEALSEIRGKLEEAKLKASGP